MRRGEFLRSLTLLPVGLTIGLVAGREECPVSLGENGEVVVDSEGNVLLQNCHVENGLRISCKGAARVHDSEISSRSGHAAVTLDCGPGAAFTHNRIWIDA